METDDGRAVEGGVGADAGHVDGVWSLSFRSEMLARLAYLAFCRN